MLVGYTGVLNSTGPAGAFDFRRLNEISKLRAPLQDITLTPIYHPSAHIDVSDQVAKDPASIAAGRGKDIGGTGDYNTPGGIGDGSNAQIIAAAMKQGSRMIGHAKNPEDFYNGLIAKLGTESRAAREASMRQKDNVVQLNNLRQSVMGVSLDEEMANMVQFQHAYNAAATRNQYHGPDARCHHKPDGRVIAPGPGVFRHDSKYKPHTEQHAGA